MRWKFVILCKYSVATGWYKCCLIQVLIAGGINQSDHRTDKQVCVEYQSTDRSQTRVYVPEGFRPDEAAILIADTPVYHVIRLGQVSF